MRDALAIMAGVITVAATLPYILNTLRGRTRPNIVTWSTWTLLNVITAAAAFSAHAVQTGIFAAAGALCTALIAAAGLRGGVKRYTVFDVVCQILALAGVVLWRTTGTPAVAISFNIAADLLGALPTYRHAWRRPHEETWQTFGYSAVGALLVLVAVKSLNFVSLAYPLYLLLSDLSLVATILYGLRRKAATGNSGG